MSTSASLHLATEADAHRRQPATTAVRAAIDSDRAHGAIVPPLVLSSNFSFQGYAQPRQYDYTRTGNPTRDQLAHALAELEGGAGAVVTATGMAADPGAATGPEPGEPGGGAA
jgi:cystathionine gamma-synthase